MITVDDFKREVRILVAALQATRLAAQTGVSLNLSGLQQQARLLSDYSVELANSGDPEIKPLLIGLVDEFNILAETLREQHGAIIEQLGNSQKRHQALKAYGKPPKPKKPTPK